MISHNKKFIFIHIPKTGGTSYAYSLYKYCEKIIKHQFVSEIINEAKPDINYFKFTIIRNPWEREISRYFYQKQTPENPYYTEAKNLSFKEWLYKRITDKKYLAFYGAPQINWLVDKNDELLVDFIARKERIQKDWAVISDTLNINDKLPWLNKSKHGHYTEHYDDETDEIISSVYKKDIDFFDYKFN